MTNIEDDLQVTEYTCVTDGDTSTFIFPNGISKFCKDNDIDLLLVESGELMYWKKGQKGWEAFPETDAKNVISVVPRNKN